MMSYKRRFVEDDKLAEYSLDLQEEEFDQEFMEHLLNMKASGHDLSVFMYLYALIDRWDVDKLIYYHNLLNEVKCNGS